MTYNVRARELKAENVLEHAPKVSHEDGGGGSYRRGS
jgi:hypothetical protein